MFVQVKDVSAMFGIKENQIHPVRNYNSEVECVLEMGILSLRGLRQIVRYAGSFLNDMVERKEAEEGQLRRKLAHLEKEKKRKPTISASDSEGQQ